MKHTNIRYYETTSNKIFMQPTDIEPTVLPHSLIGDAVHVEWTDSYGSISGWQDLSEFKAEQLIVHSLGVVVGEDDTTISLAQNFAYETANTPKQANGIMVIPKACIASITSFASFKISHSKCVTLTHKSVQ